MSNPLAIATVSAALCRLLQRSLDRAGLDIKMDPVSAKPPDLILSDAQKPPNNLNLYLWKVTENTGLSNLDLPSRSASGERLSNQPLALDLHYVLSAMGSEDFHAEILLGHGMQVLHEHPGLTSAEISNLISAQKPGGDLVYPFLAKSDLASHVEQLKIMRQAPKDDIATKLWPALNTSLRMCAFYQVSALLTEVKRPKPSGPPIQTVNSLVERLKRPQLARVGRLETGTAPASDFRRPPAPGDWITVQGQDLAAPNGALKVGRKTISLSTAQVSDSEIRVQLPADTPVGLTVLYLELLSDFGADLQPRFRQSVVSAPLPIAIVPEIDSLSASRDPASAANMFDGTLSVTLKAPVSEGQATEILLLGPESAVDKVSIGFESVIDPADRRKLTVALRDMAAGDYIVGVRVDGADSLLEADTSGFTGPKTTLPGAP